MDIPNDLNSEILLYCKLNDITNIDEFKIKLLRSGFLIEKYGVQPFINKKQEETLSDDKDNIETNDSKASNDDKKITNKPDFYGEY